MEEESRIWGAGPMAALFAAAFLAYGYNSVFMILSPAAVLAAGGTELEAGAQGTAFLVAAVLLRGWFGPYADKRGNRRAMLVGLASFVVTGAALAVCDNFWLFCLLRCVQAIGLAAFHPCATAEVTRHASPARAGFMLGLFRATTASSLLAGPALAMEMVNAAGFSACFGALAVVAAAAVPLVAFLPADAPARIQGETAPSRTQPLRSLVAALAGQRRLQWLLAATVANSIGYGLLTSFALPLLSSENPAMNAGLFFSFFSAGGIVSTVVTGWLCDRTSSRALLAGCLGLVAAGTGAAGAAAASEATVLAAGLVAGFGSQGATVCVLALIASDANEALRSTSLALQQNAIDIGIAVSSLLFGALLSALPAPAVFCGWAAALGILVVAGMVCSRR